MTKANLRSLHPSDKLQKIIRLLDRCGLSSAIGRLQITFVVDADAIIKELIWLAVKRRNPLARTNMQEAAAARVVELISPVQVVEEVKGNIPDLARQYSVQQEKFFLLLDSYIAETPVRLVEVNDVQFKPEWQLSDPKDAPYLALMEQSEAFAILSGDKHIKRSKSHSADPEAMLYLRNYARSAAAALGLKYAGAGMLQWSLLLSAALIKAALRLEWPAFLLIGASYPLLPHLAKRWGPQIMQILGELWAEYCLASDQCLELEAVILELGPMAGQISISPNQLPGNAID